MEDDLANLNLVDEEEEAFQEDAVVVDQNLQLSLVGRCLTDSIVHFPSLRNTMANLWHPIRGICISDMRERRILFQFFHEVDIQRVLAGTPWWLREADETESILLENEREFRGRNLGNMSVSGNTRRNDLAQFYPNPNFIPLGSSQSVHDKGLTKWTNVANHTFNEAVVGHGPIELHLDEEHDSLHASKGKKVSAC
ncbi:hypothetical protein J1N35_041733 [Gossypium stocksii]|uniref:DUF4283 domain-containing protein n=1 Tax=Gossypium stocksii TaxID=47602 RepID=A0A9D3UG65_9ROSI|nr:hypothetical protein J1N35_041733 [Gossypium stocksii]